MDSNEPSDNEDGESLKKILSLVGGAVPFPISLFLQTASNLPPFSFISAQFSKKSSDRAKRSENEHIQQLESKRSELAKDIGKSAALHQEKIDSLKRELSLHVEEFAGSAKKIKVGMEKSLVRLRCGVAMLVAPTESLFLSIAAGSEWSQHHPSRNEFEGIDEDSARVLYQHGNHAWVFHSHRRLTLLKLISFLFSFIYFRGNAAR